MILLLLRSALKTRRSISKSSTPLLVGLLLGIFILSQSTIHSVAEHAVASKKEQKSGQEDSQPQVKLTEAVPSPSTQINLDYQSFLLKELHQEESEDEENTSFSFDVPLEKALKVLFQQIISPNAP